MIYWQAVAAEHTRADNAKDTEAKGGGCCAGVVAWSLSSCLVSVAAALRPMPARARAPSPEDTRRIVSHLLTQIGAGRCSLAESDRFLVLLTLFCVVAWCRCR